MSESHSGHCRCGQTRFTATGRPRWVAHCHCESCRRATGAPLTTYASFAADGFAFDGEPPQVYESSPGVRRRFCARCGSPLTYDADRWSGEVHVHLSALDRPGDFVPRLHAYVGERIPWLEIDDALPRFRETGGRGVEPVGYGPRRRED